MSANESTVTLQGQDGKSYDFPLSKGLEALQRGFRFQSGDEAKQQAFRDTFGQLPVTAGVARAAGVASFGLSDLALHEAGLGEGMQQLREANPDASAAGTAAGFALPLAGAISPVLKGLGGGIDAVSAGGQAIRAGASAAAAKLGTSGLAKSIVERYVPAALGYGAEGAVYGAGQALTEQSLGDHEVAAEKILAGAGLGAMAGGALGGGMVGAGDLAGATFGLLQKGTRKLAATIGDLYQAQTGQVAADGLGAAYAKAASAASGKSADVIAKFVSNPEARDLAEQGASNDLRDRATLDIAGAMNKANELSRPITEEAVGPLKGEVVGNMIPKHLVDNAAETSIQKIEGLEQQVADMQKQPGNYGRGTDLKKYAKILAAKKDAVIEAGVRGDGGKIFSEMDQLKRLTGPFAKFDARISNQSIEGATTNEFKNAYEGLRQHLEDADTWGQKASDLQKAANAKWAAFLSPEAYRNNFMVKTGNDLHGPIYEANPSAIRGLLDNMGTAKNSLDYRYFSQRAQLQQDLIEEVANKYEMSPEVRKRVTEAAEHVDKLKSTLGDIEQRVTLANQLRDLGQSEGSKIPTMLGGAAGFMLGGPLGAAAGASAGELLARPDIVIRQLAAISHIAKGVDGEAAGHISALLKKGAEAVAPQTRRYVAPIATTAALSKSFLSGQSSDEDQRENFHKRVAELSQLANDPGMVARHETERNQDWAQAAPSVAQEVQQKRMAAIGFLLDKAPKDPTAGLTMNPLANHWEPSSADLSKWSRYVRAVQDPLSVVRDLAAGHVTQESIDAMRTVYPKLYQQSVVGIATAMSEVKHTLPYATRLNVGAFIGAPTDPSMTVAFAQAMAKAGQPDKDDTKSPKIGGAMDLAAQSATPSQKLEMSRST